ncbi:MAG: hypothetical protein Q4D38_02000 [Planctomycetia bacterium]|nr:hypothetical protein [Planctomycetia bacterium]
MRPLHGMILGLSLLALFGMSTGCQSHIGGQTLPSGYYLHDDVQYFAPPSSNTLENESVTLQRRGDT